MKIKTTYIAQSKSYFMNDIFYRRNISDQFNIFNSESCFNDMIYSENTNINIYDGRLWLNCGIATKADFFDKIYRTERLNKDSKVSVYVPGFGNIRSKNQLEEYGKKEDFFERLGIKYKKLKSLFIPHLGSIHYSNKVFPAYAFEAERRFKNKFYFTKKILTNDLSLFGLTTDQHFSHIPFTIGKNLKLKIVKNKKKNTLWVEDKKFFIDPRIKIHITPYGLLTIHVTYSITSNSYYNNDELTEIQKLILVKNDFEIIFKKQIFSNFNHLTEFIKNQVCSKILKVYDKNKIEDLGPPLSTVNLSFESGSKESESNTEMLTEKKVLGLLNIDSNYLSYNEAYINSFSSLFGKYKNDFVFTKKNRLLYSFDPIWENYSKKAMFNWAVNQTFYLFTIHKYLDKIFNETLNIISKKKKLTDEELNNLIDFGYFINGFDHYKNLPNSLRKLFYEINNSNNFDFEKYDYVFIQELKEKFKNQKIADSLVFQPNFMGFGIDLIKLKNSIFAK